MPLSWEISCSNLQGIAPTQHYKSNSLNVLPCQSNAGCNSCLLVIGSLHSCFVGCNNYWETTWNRPIILEGVILAEIASECSHGPPEGIALSTLEEMADKVMEVAVCYASVAALHATLLVTHLLLQKPHLHCLLHLPQWLQILKTCAQKLHNWRS